MDFQSEQALKAVAECPWELRRIERRVDHYFQTLASKQQLCSEGQKAWLFLRAAIAAVKERKL